MSRGGRKGKGIAYGYWEKFGGEIHRDDSIIVKGFEQAVPGYYDSQLKAVDEAAHRAIKARRKARALARASENTDARLAVAERVFKAKLALRRSRSYEG